MEFVFGVVFGALYWNFLGNATKEVFKAGVAWVQNFSKKD